MPLFKLNLAIAKFRPAVSTGPIEAEILHTANQLYEARRDRLVAAASGIPNVMWAVTLLGGALTVGFSFLFGVPNFRIHLIMTEMLSASLALVIVLIVALLITRGRIPNTNGLLQVWRCRQMIDEPWLKRKKGRSPFHGCR